MTLDGNSPAEYLVGHVEDALARDPRVNEQGLHVELTGSVTEQTAVVSGTVTSAAHKQNIAEVVSELLPDHRVEDCTTVADYSEDGEAEEVR